MKDLAPWIIGGATVLLSFFGLLIASIRRNNAILHERVSKTQNRVLGQQTIFASKSEFEDHRKETRHRFDKLEKKVDEIPEKVRKLLNGEQ